MPSTAINSSAAGAISSLTDTSYSNARGASTGTVNTNTQITNAIRFLKSASRGGATYSITRYFIRFDTSAISTSVTTATLTIKSNGTNFMSPSVTVMKAAAFNGSNNSLTGTDYATVNFSTAYSSTYPTWNGGGSNNTITLNSSARTDIQNNSSFIVAVISTDFDLANEDTEFESLDSNAGIEQGSSDIHLDVTHDDASGYSHPVIGVASANISTIKGVATANVGAVSGLIS